jgi:hypothetical protein
MVIDTDFIPRILAKLLVTVIADKFFNKILTLVAVYQP